jgi:hypothetical protein
LMIFSTLPSRVWLLSTLLDSGFGGSLMLTGGDVILTVRPHSKSSAIQRSTYQSLYFSAPYYHPPRSTYGRMFFNCTTKMKYWSCHLHCFSTFFIVYDCEGSWNHQQHNYADNWN